MIEISLKKQLNFANGKGSLDVNWTIEKGEFVTLYGQSGAGKTSILRMIAGLMLADSGKITVDNQIWLDTDNQFSLAPQKRNIGFVFQDYALFPNMTVLENLRFALPAKNADMTIITELIELTELQHLQNRKTTTLSGGQKQRVALARALVQQPKLLILDEPLSALDNVMRQKLQNYLKVIHQKYQLTILLVSHDIEEIKKLSDKVVILENGQIQRIGTPGDIFKNKENSDYKLKGKVISIRKKDNEFIIEIEVGGNMIEMAVSSEKGKEYWIGKEVILEMNLKKLN